MELTYEFKHYLQALNQHFDKMIEKGMIFFTTKLPEEDTKGILLSHPPVMSSTILWNTYLNSFPEDLRQEHVCYCCFSFFKYYGSIVGVDPVTLEKVSIWDFETGCKLMDSILSNLTKIVNRAPINGIPGTTSEMGTGASYLDKEGKPPIYYHWAIQHSIPLDYSQKRTYHAKANNISSAFIKIRAELELNTIYPEYLSKTIEAAKNDELPRSAQFLPELERFKEVCDGYKQTSDKDIYCWVQAYKSGPFSNKLIGTFVANLHNGETFNQALSKLTAQERTYQAPTSTSVSANQIVSLRKALEEGGFMPSLKRKVAALTDIDPNYVLYSQQEVEGDIFSKIRTSSGGKIGGEKISLRDFLKVEFLKKINSLQVYVDPKHGSNFVTMIAPANPNAPVLTPWSNGYTWTFRNNHASVITERVKSAGGVVDSELRVSLAWEGPDDLDLYANYKNYTLVYYGNRSYRNGSSHLTLDVDANGGHVTSLKPVENIYGSIKKATFIVNNFSGREGNNGFQIEVKIEDSIQSYSYNKSIKHKEKVELFTIKDGKIDNIHPDLVPIEAECISGSIWGLNVSQWVEVTQMCMSPNYWGDNIGNEFLFMFLKGCSWGESTKPRGIFNEMVRNSIKEGNRQALNHLGSLIEVETIKGPECSGLGFNTSQATSFFVKVNQKQYEVVC